MKIRYAASPKIVILQSKLLISQRIVHKVEATTFFIVQKVHFQRLVFSGILSYCLPVHFLVIY